MITIAARGISFRFDPDCGFLRALVVSDQGQRIAPMHRVPWAREVLAPEIPSHLRDMEGDFFCAPFAACDAGSPMHGWPANGHWQVQGGPVLRATLGHPVRGALVVKELSVTDDHPFVYQRHVFVGGSGTVSVANHAMVSLPDGGLIRWSPKRWFESAPAMPEPDPARGRSALAYPARSADPRAFPRTGGGTADLTRYPWTPGHEDFVVGVEAPGHVLGWTAVTRPAQGDLYLSLRHAQRLPMTMMWHSDAGRDYAPWNGRHRGCLGVEEGLAPHMLGVGAPADMAAGLALSPDGTAEVRHAIGAIAWPSGEPVAAVTSAPGSLTVTGEGGATRTLPFRDGFLE